MADSNIENDGLGNDLISTRLPQVACFKIILNMKTFSSDSETVSGLGGKDPVCAYQTRLKE
jgi:hypothetical protein